LRRIPILVHDGAVIADSSVIAEYLEEIAPTPAVLPSRAVDRAKARWIDEYADTRMGDVFIWNIFGKAVVAPAIFGAPRDLDAVGKAMREDLPQVMSDLEKLAPARGGLFGAYGLADISTAVHFANLRWSRQTVDAARWPRTMAWIHRVETETPLAHVTALAERVLRVRPEKHRAVLTASGVAVSATSVAGVTPQRGPMTRI
jgi:glutathione S-transferase